MKKPETKEFTKLQKIGLSIVAPFKKNDKGILHTDQKKIDTYKIAACKCLRDELVKKASHITQGKNKHKKWNMVEKLITDIEDLNNQIKALENGS